ncbi:hypothetical protein BU17DRAFT_58823 [Hysterangium stoloniferum]|nr:hypothetical protein BU17DRAFT_58823 [Hysterangium stoloniferum]
MIRLARLSTMSSKLSISSLPLPPTTHILTKNLTADPHTPDPATFHSDVLSSRPSLQRRARQLDEAAHYSHVSPLPFPFPYRIEIGEDLAPEDRGKAVESWLAEKEALDEVDLNTGQPTLKAYTSHNRIKDYHLFGVSARGINDCVPALDVGDAFEHIGIPSLSSEPTKAPINGSATSTTSSDKPVTARQLLTDVLSGHTVLFDPSKDKGYGPWSLRYSGHQFGNWAGQLGDGRAISILETPHPDNPNVIYELQLKGAGRTPFSRSADGLAVLRSSIREYLGAEAIHALGIPSTRSLAMVLYPSIPVRRESAIPEKAAVVTRVAPSFIRIGNFEGLNPPQNVYAFSFVGQQSANWEGLRILGEWVSKRVLQLNLGASQEGQTPAWGKELVLECARRNGRMVAGWQVYGFMHGVMNTDNISIIGLTIDYGPYAFMDVYDENHVCNHTDEQGRYAYKFQPTMIIYALRALLTSLSPLIGAEMTLGHAVQAGWADGVSRETLENWREDAMELQQEVEETVMEAFNETYWPLMRKRLGLRHKDADDPNDLIRPLLKLMETHDLDFHSTFRMLCSFQPSSDKSYLEGFAAQLTPEYLVASEQRRQTAQKDWIEWLEKYGKRIESEQGDWGDSSDWMKLRVVEARKANPRFVLRQWVLEEVIKKAEEDPTTGRRILAKVLEMASNPFETWGAEDETGQEEELDTEVREERRYCELGAKKFLGFQCSCSS